MANPLGFLDNIFRSLNLNPENDENQAVNDAVETAIPETQPETPMTTNEKKSQSLWGKMLSSNWGGGISDAINTTYASMFGGLPGVGLKLYGDYKANQAKKEYEAQKPVTTGVSVETPNVVNIATTDEEAKSYQTNKDMPFWDWMGKNMNELGLIYNNLNSYGGTKYFKDDFGDTYKEDINKIYQWKQGLVDGNITQDEYDDYIKWYAEEALRAHGKTDVDSPGISGVHNIDRLVQSINKDINTLGSSQNLQDKISKLDPQWAAEMDASDKIKNNVISHIMEGVNEELKYYKGGNKQDIINDAYSTSSDITSREVNAIAPARRVIASLQAKYGTLDTANYTQADKALLDYAQHIEDFFNQVVVNQGDYYKSLVRQADSDTNTLIVPEILDGLNYHDWMFKNTENILTDEDYEGLWGFDRDNYSVIDVLENMSSRLATMNADANGGWLDYVWTNTQRALRPIGPVTQEIGQQTFGQAYLDLYNIASKQTGKIDFNMLNEDNTIVSTMSSNKSTAGRLIQKYTANLMEYAPEVMSEVGFTAWGAGIPARIRNIKEFRLLANNVGLKGWSRLNSAIKSKIGGGNLMSYPIRYWRGFKEAADTGKIIKDGKTLFDVSRDFGDASKLRRAAQWFTTDFVPEVAWDQAIDASLSSADTDFGSDASMAFSLGGTILGNILGKIGEAGLYRMGKNGLNNIIHGRNPLNNITEGTVWDFLDIVNGDNINKLLRLQYGGKNNLNMAQLSELSKYASDYRTISDLTKKALGAISSEDARRVTQAVKNGVYKEIAPYINQVYGGQSEFARKVAQLVADDRTNVADLTKYILGVDNRVGVFGWTSKISLADNANRYATNYKEALDTVFSDGSFRKKMTEGFGIADLEELQKRGYSWANPEKGYMKKVGDDTYFFTKDGLDAAKNDIMTTSLSMPVLSKASQSAEDFDSLMKNATFRKISDETLQDIKNSGAYDTLADALAEIEQLCGIKI